MDRPEPGLVKWSPNANVDSFLHINLQHRIVHVYEPTGRARRGQFDYRRLSKHDDFPHLTTYDWSPAIPGLLAVGTSTGVVNLLRIDDNSNAYHELGLKMSRTCQAVAFSTGNMLAVGLDRVRSDRCLYLWDVNRLSTLDLTSGGIPPELAPTEPVDHREPSVSVSSVKFFEDNPSTLVVGIKGQGVRIHDLRGRLPSAIPDVTFCLPAQIRCNQS
jgi:WD repeat-containing protein mio